MTRLTVGLQGGSGFIGSALANELIKRGHSLVISTRKLSNARELRILPNTKIIEVDMNRQEELDRCFSQCNCVVNLIGILNEKKDNGVGFNYAHVELASRLNQACKVNNIDHIVQVSSLGADIYSDSFYLASKGKAEELLKAEKNPKIKLTIIRPSVVFGPEDNFTNNFSLLLKYSRGFMPLPCPDAKLQPVYVNDLAKGISNVIENKALADETYEIGGADIFTLTEIIKYIATVIGVPNRIIPLNDVFSKLQANFMEYIPGKPFSKDNFRSLAKGSVCSSDKNLRSLGVKPVPMNQVLPQYLTSRSVRDR